MMEEPSELPEGWMWTKLRDVADVITGNTPPKKDQENYGDYIPFVKPPELNDCIITKSVDNLSEKGAKIARILSPESILVSCIGILGKTGINAVPIAFNQQINAAIFSENILPKYGFYYFQTPEAKELLNKKSSSTTIPIVNKSRFKTLQFPLPPLNEQHRIVTKLEALLAQVNASKDHLAKVPQIGKQFRQSVLAAACSGELTKEWRKEHPEVEPASELLKRIQEDRVQKYEEECRKVEAAGRKKPKKPMNLELEEFETAGLPTLPNNWLWTNLHNLASLITKGATPTSYGFNYVDKGINFVRVENIVNGSIDSNSLYHITQETHEFLKRSQLRDNDILFSIAGTIGRSSIVRAHDLPANTNQALAIIRLPYDHISIEYTHFALMNQTTILNAQKEMRGVGMNNISLGDVNSFVIPIPPLSEQFQIVTKVENLFSLADEVEQQYQKALYHVDHLTQSLLAKAFRGELVPQDPNDEPASVLLERIKQERAKNEKEKKPRKKESKTLLDYC